MMNNLQIIHTPKGDALAVLPLKQYQKLVARQQDDDDEESPEELLMIAEQLALLKAGKLKTIPFETIKKRMKDPPHPVFSIRKHRGLTAAALAKKSGVGRVTTTHIENRTRRGTVENYKALAKALGVSVDNIIEWSDRG